MPPRTTTTPSCSTSCCPGSNGFKVCARVREAGQLDADPDAHRQGRRARRGRGARYGRRRLPHQAVLLSSCSWPACARCCAAGCTERPAVLEAGDLRLDPAAHRCLARRRRDRTQPAREFSLLEFLMRRPGEVTLEARDPRTRVGLRVRRRPEHRRGLRRHLRKKIDAPFGPRRDRDRRGWSATGLIPVAGSRRLRRPGDGTGRTTAVADACGRRGAGGRVGRPRQTSGAHHGEERRRRSPRCRPATSPRSPGRALSPRPRRARRRRRRAGAGGG